MGSERIKKAHLSVGLQSSLLTSLLPGVDPGVYARGCSYPSVGEPVYQEISNLVSQRPFGVALTEIAAARRRL
jgi:hypothetical protein